MASLRPGITAALIVKNEAIGLHRCLESLKGWVADLVVVDTGSSDDTVAIAKKHGARVFTFEWVNDFSAARNASLAYVETEWVLIIDADEWFEADQGIKTLKGTQIENAVAMEISSRNVIEGGAWTEHRTRRLFRFHPSLRFVGAIHESIPLPTLKEAFPNGQIVDVGAWYWHSGYSNPKISKPARNLPYLQAEVARDPEDLYYLVELMMTLQDLEAPEADAEMQSLRSKVLALGDCDEAPTQALSPGLSRMLQHVDDAELKSYDVDMLIRLARGWFPTHPGPLAMIAQVELRRGDVRAAFATLSELERLVVNDAYDRSIAVHPSIIGENLFTNLALVAHQLGRKDVAKRNYDRLLVINPRHPIALQNLPAL